MDGARFYFLGEFKVETRGQKVQFEGQKCLELLCYLVLHRQPQRREKLLNLLWQDSPRTKAQKRLRQTLWKLQSASSAFAHTLIESVGEWIRLDPGFAIWSDVGELQRAFEETLGVPGVALSDEQVRLLQRATELYQTDLLEGHYSDWCLFEQERFKNMLLVLLDKLLAHCEAHRRFDWGICFGMRLLEFDYAGEKTHQRLMRLHYEAGDRTGALRQFERCRSALEEDFGIEPTQLTLELHKRICNNLALNNVLDSTQSKWESAPDSRAIRTYLITLQDRIHADLDVVVGLLSDDVNSNMST